MTSINALRASTWLTGLLLCPLLNAQSLSSLAVFGDNIADPGNIPAYLEAANAAGLGPFDSNFPPSPPYSANRYSNGPVAAEYLATLFGLPPSAVDNLAVGNAFSDQLPVSLAGGALIGNGSAIPMPIGRELTPLNNTDVNSQVNLYLSQTGTIDSDALMLVYASANDGALALNTVALLGLDGAAAGAVIQSGAVANGHNTVAAARLLADAGARQIVLATLPDIGQTPAAMAGGLAGVTAATAFSQITNATLAAEANQLAQDTGAVVWLFDSTTLLNDIVSNPAKYGLSNVDVPCLALVECASSPALADQFLFWDAFFPTTRVHDISARAIADTVNAPKTLAAQGETARLAMQSFTHQLLPVRTPAASTLSVGIERHRIDRDGERFAFGFDSTIRRLRIGADLVGDTGWSARMNLAVDDGDSDLDGIDAGFDLDSIRIGASVSYQRDRWRWSLAAAYSDDEHDRIVRHTQVVDQIATASADGDSLQLIAELGTQWQTNAWTWLPSIRLAHASSDLSGYSETGATALEQQVDGRQSEMDYVEIAVNVLPRQTDPTAAFTPYAGLSIRQSISDHEQRIDSRLISLPEVTRRLQIAAPDELAVQLVLGARIRLNEQWQLDMSGHYLDADRLSQSSVGAQLSYRF